MWGRRTQRGDFEYADRMSPLWSELVELGGEAEIAALLDHPEAAVRYCAAARLHRHDPETARSVMSPIASEAPPLGEFAKRLLDRWPRPTSRDSGQTIHFSGTITGTGYWRRCTERAWVTHFDPRFAVEVDVTEVEPGGPLKRGPVTFAVHSLAQSFFTSSDELVGAAMRFEIEGTELDGAWRLMWLRGYPANR